MIIILYYDNDNCDLLLTLFSGSNIYIGWVGGESLDSLLFFFSSRTKKIDNFLPKISSLGFFDMKSLMGILQTDFISAQQWFIVWSWLTPRFDEKILVSIAFFEVEGNIPNRKWLKWRINNLPYQTKFRRTKFSAYKTFRRTKFLAVSQIFGRFVRRNFVR